MKINLRESLNELDMLSDNRYDLYNTYLAKNPSLDTKKKLSEAIYNNKSPKEILMILNEDWDDEEELEWEEMNSKLVRDSDGFLTDYTWYRNNETGQNVFVFGDKDLYGPEDGYFDWECDTDMEGYEWFINYEGPGDEDDWMDESLKEAKFIEPKYRDGDVVFVGDANGYHGSFLIEGDVKNIPKELYKHIHKITKYGNLDEPYYKVEYKLDSNHLFEEDYRKFFEYIIPVLKNAGITIIDEDELNKPKNSSKWESLKESDETLKWKITYDKGKPDNKEEVVEFPTYKEAKQYAADHAKGWGFEVEKLEESLDEAMVKVEPSDKELNQVINVLNKYGFKLDDNYKPGKGLFGSYHIQVINPDLDYIDFDQLVKDVEPVGDALDNLSFDINMPITYNFGSNDDNVITGGIDIHVGYRDDGLDESLTEDLAYVLQKLHDEDDNLWNLHGTDYTWLYTELDKYGNIEEEEIADLVRKMPKSKQYELFDKLVEPLHESLREEKLEDEFVTKKGFK